MYLRLLHCYFGRELPDSRAHYGYFCTSKASKLSTCDCATAISVESCLLLARSSSRSVYVSIRQHTSTQVSIGQHTPVHVSTRQHTEERSVFLASYSSLSAATASVFVLSYQ